MEMVVLYNYNGNFEVPKEWLKENINGMNVNEFLDSYTWDEGEWLHILFSMREDEKKIRYLTQKLKEGLSLFKNEGKEGILHSCPNKKFEYQFSYFDKLGPVGDIQKNSLEEMAKSIYEYGFIPCEKDDLNIIK